MVRMELTTVSHLPGRYATFGLGMRCLLAPLVALLFTAVFMAPSIVLLQFKIDQARIERELCVQRERMEGMRTCHGECQLSKRFRALEQEAGAGFPADRVQVRFEPVVDFAPLPRPIIALRSELLMAEPSYRLCAGYGPTMEPVPWA